MVGKKKNQKNRFKSKKSDLNQINPIFLIFLKKSKKSATLLQITLLKISRCAFLYLIVYDFIRFRCAEKCVPQKTRPDLMCSKKISGLQMQFVNLKNSGGGGGGGGES